jgi:DNA-binding transcriptional LysR family regulator
MFDIGQLRCFVIVAEELHFGRAATRLHMTQPPLSRQIKVLEHIIGATLLERSSRSVRLTLAGRSFLPEAKRILKLAESASQVVRRIAEGKAGSIKIGFTATSAYSFLPDLIKIYRERLPDIDLSLKEMVSGDQFEALASGQIDVGFLRPPVAGSGIQSILVAAEPLLVAVPEDHALAATEEFLLADIDGQPFVMFSPYESRYFHDLLLSQFTRAGVLPRFVQHLSQVHSILALVRAGLGLAIVPAAAASLNFRGVILRPLQLRSPAPVELLMAWRRDHENPLLPELIEIANAMAPRSGAGD